MNMRILPASCSSSRRDRLNSARATYDRPVATIKSKHWDSAYEAGDSVSWFQLDAAMSKRLIETVCVDPDAKIIDIGGGSSSLVDALLEGEHQNVSVLDLSARALEDSKRRLGPRSNDVQWLVADLLDWTPAHTYDVWHDRAVLHFLTTREDQQKYRAALGKAVSVGGHVVIGVFAEDGPVQCSGLEVRRYSSEELVEFLGAEFSVINALREDHETPSGKVQHFNWILARRDSREPGD